MNKSVKGNSNRLKPIKLVEIRSKVWEKRKNLSGLTWIPWQSKLEQGLNSINLYSRWKRSTRSQVKNKNWTKNNFNENSLHIGGFVCDIEHN
jgi:hypothetical protein